MTTIIKILNRGFVQRIIYGIGIILWTLIMWTDLINFPLSKSSLGVPYLILYLIPTVVLAIQTILNTRLLWWTIWLIFSGYILISVILVIIDSIERSGNHPKAISWTINDILQLFFVFGVLLIVDWIIYYLKPTMKMKN